MAKYKVGDSVYYYHPESGLVNGKVTKVHRSIIFGNWYDIYVAPNSHSCGGDFYGSAPENEAFTDYWAAYYYIREKQNCCKKKLYN